MKYPGDVTENGPKTSAEVKNAWSHTTATGYQTTATGYQPICS
jgi:hypothetical protein